MKTFVNKELFRFSIRITIRIELSCEDYFPQIRHKNLIIHPIINTFYQNNVIARIYVHLTHINF